MEGVVALRGATTLTFKASWMTGDGEDTEETLHVQWFGGQPPVLPSRKRCGLEDKDNLQRLREKTRPRSLVPCPPG